MDHYPRICQVLRAPIPSAASKRRWASGLAGRSGGLRITCSKGEPASSSPPAAPTPRPHRGSSPGSAGSAHSLAGAGAEQSAAAGREREAGAAGLRGRPPPAQCGAGRLPPRPPPPAPPPPALQAGTARRSHPAAAAPSAPGSGQRSGSSGSSSSGRRQREGPPPPPPGSAGLGGQPRREGAEPWPMGARARTRSSSCELETEIGKFSLPLTWSVQGTCLSLPPCSLTKQGSCQSKGPREPEPLAAQPTEMSRSRKWRSRIFFQTLSVQN
uniref:cuticle collagen 2-like n=1 Tax=Halichoerus grypus TaxID=9711 RepID=UPI001659BC79|nr:cuticle collagen 2-like [Halichoerus grypus]